MSGGVNGTKRSHEDGGVVTRHNNFFESNSSQVYLKGNKTKQDSQAETANDSHTNTKSTKSLTTRDPSRPDSPRSTAITPKTQVSVVTENSRTNALPSASSSRPTLKAGLESSFASLRRSSATPDLLNSSSVFDPAEFMRPISSKTGSAKSRSGSVSSSSRPRRPPTIESRSVSICETEVSNLIT